MKKILLIITSTISIILLCSFSYLKLNADNYKCIIQLKNYDEGGAYVVASLIKPDGSYQKSLSVSGDDFEWLEELHVWWKFFKAEEKTIHGISGESITSGERKVLKFNFDEKLLDKGYKIRFETAVEDGKYHKKDVEFDLNKANIKTKIKGNGYIRFVMLMKK